MEPIKRFHNCAIVSRFPRHRCGPHGRPQSMSFAFSRPEAEHLGIRHFFTIQEFGSEMLDELGELMQDFRQMLRLARRELGNITRFIDPFGPHDLVEPK